MREGHIATCQESVDETHSQGEGLAGTALRFSQPALSFAGFLGRRRHLHIPHPRSSNTRTVTWRVADDSDGRLHASFL